MRSTGTKQLKSSARLPAIPRALACLSVAAPLFAAAAVRADDPAKFTVHPDQPQQVVWGLGFEIQCDSIASGNVGFTDSTVSVPHDLVPSERDRLADEMLKGFRYCRLAGGLYWRGLDAEQKQLQPRWPEQLGELKTLLDRAGVESLSFEYWSPPPFWKASRSYTASGKGWAHNVLRCYGPDFKDDEVYHGDKDRFLKDFAQAVCGDITTLQSAGLKVGFFGLQNEPFASTAYSSCYYGTKDYGPAFTAVASAVRRAHPEVKIIADTGPTQPNFIAPVMKDPDTAKLVDLLVIHAVGADSSTVRKHVGKAREMISQPLPIYQNEYEYLDGQATPKRCVNTVQNIMNWYQLAASPTWYWIHCLKPVGNSEASGYSLGFWQPMHPETQREDAPAPVKAPRTSDRGTLSSAPRSLIGLPIVHVARGNDHEPAQGYSFTINTPADVFIAVHRRGTPTIPSEWERTPMKTQWSNNGSEDSDVIYRRHFEAGEVKIPGNDGKLDSGYYAAPSLAIIKSSTSAAVRISALPPGRNAGIGTLESRPDPVGAATANLEPGHFTWNNYNWFSVVGFLKYMPWDSTVVKIDEPQYDHNRRLLAYRKPDGKLVVVVSNRTGKPVQFEVATGANSRFSGVRYTPDDAGPGFRGQPVGKSEGGHLQITVPNLSWEFWTEQ